MYATEDKLVYIGKLSFSRTVSIVSLFVTKFIFFRSLKAKRVTGSVEKEITENDGILTSPKLPKTPLSSNEKVVQQCIVLPF